MKKTLSLYLGILLALSLQANNIQVSNVTLTGQNAAADYTLVQFDLSWENSWRISSGPSNYDGAWVFVKYRTAGGNWNHGILNYVDGTASGDGHTEPAGGTITTPSDGTGAFIYRNVDGSGDVNFQTIQLRWDYGASSVSDNAVIDVQVLAVEMVYIPEGTYQLGATSDGSEIDNFYYNNGIFGFQSAFTISSEDAITVSPAEGSTNLYYDVLSINNSGDQLGPIPAAFPKGFAAFWIMKYEMTEGQWVCFFNLLSETQKLAHDITDSEFGHKNDDLINFGNTIAWTSGNATSQAPDRVCAYTIYRDNAAYLDWTGLRFMTELEYEKACKGPVHIDDMFASGGTTLYEMIYLIQNSGQANEIISNPGVDITNINFEDSFSGPLRAGIFAASSPNNTREETGGTYYGVMEMSGSLLERAVSVGSPGSRSYDGAHGDGMLTSSGISNVVSWPDEGTFAKRGGSWGSQSIRTRVADRSYGGQYFGSGPLIGIRGVRTSE